MELNIDLVTLAVSLLTFAGLIGAMRNELRHIERRLTELEKKVGKLLELEENANEQIK